MDPYRIDPKGYPKRRERLMARFLDEFFWKCFFMLRMNQVEGDYLEFGVGGSSRSFRLAYKYKVLERPETRLFAFDSFQGLPRPQGIDCHPQWHEGQLAITEKQLRARMRQMGARRSDYHVIPGFFSISLDRATPAAYDIQKAAMVHVDCDLYESTGSVLNFIKGILAEGAVIAFDDWYCFDGSPEKGEQRAFREFLAANRQLEAVEYLNFGWHGKSFIIHHKAPRRPARRKTI